jgi:hypothetical protein
MRCIMQRAREIVRCGVSSKGGEDLLLFMVRQRTSIHNLGRISSAVVCIVVSDFLLSCFLTFVEEDICVLYLVVLRL